MKNIEYMHCHIIDFRTSPDDGWVENDPVFKDEFGFNDKTVPINFDWLKSELSEWGDVAYVCKLAYVIEKNKILAYTLFIPDTINLITGYAPDVDNDTKKFIAELFVEDIYSRYNVEYIILENFPAMDLFDHNREIGSKYAIDHNIAIARKQNFIC